MAETMAGCIINSREDLARYFAELGFKVGAEIGVLRGDYSEVLCGANPGVKLFCIDSWGIGENRRREYHLGMYERAKIKLSLYNTKLIYKLSMEAIKEFEDESLDFVYIDANHSSEFVREDVWGWSKKVRKGGIVSGHDYNLFRIAEIVDEYVKSNGFNLRVTNRGYEALSWWFMKELTDKSMLGKWDGWYKNINTMGAFRYGDTVTYRLAADFMADIDEVEDWGCGTGGFKRFYGGKYIGIDGSANPFVDKIADLREYKSNVDGIMMRHVLEHNYDWKLVLQNAVESFKKKLCLIVFTPFMDETKEIAHNKKYGVDVPDIAFAKNDIEAAFAGLKWRSESYKTRTGYGMEHIYYIEK